MSYQCALHIQTPQATMTIRTRTPANQLPQVLGGAFHEIATYLASQGEQPAGAPFVAYHNMDMQNLDVEIGFPVRRALPPHNRLCPGAMPEGKVATCMYTGPYEDMKDAYDALAKWIEDNGYQATGLAIEVYLSDPQVTAPDQLQTQIMFPLMPA